MDPNREIEEAAQGDPLAEAAYQTFHGYIRLAREIVGRGILYDVHRQVLLTVIASMTKLNFPNM